MTEERDRGVGRGMETERTMDNARIEGDIARENKMEKTETVQ